MKQKGFTLVEVLVAIGLFSILFAIAGGGFVSALRTQRQVSALMSAESNVGIALEEMAREMRTGYLFCHDFGGAQTCNIPADPLRQCTSLVTGQDVCSDLAYYSAAGEGISYILQNGVLERGVNGTYQPITGDNVTIRSLSFIVYGNNEGDHWNPRITIAVSISPNDSSVSWDTINLQTTVSAREIDCTQTSSPSC